MHVVRLIGGLTIVILVLQAPLAGYAGRFIAASALIGAFHERLPGDARIFGGGKAGGAEHHKGERGRHGGVSKCHGHDTLSFIFVLR